MANTGTLANREDPGEMLHNATFHKGLHSLLRNNLSSEQEIQYFREIIIWDPAIYIMGHPDLTASNFMENSIGPIRDKDTV